MSRDEFIETMKGMAKKTNKVIFLILSMVVCAGLFIFAGFNIYAYGDLGINSGIWGTIYTVSFLTSLVLFFLCLISLLKTLIEKPKFRFVVIGLFVLLFISFVMFIRSCNSMH